MGRLSKPVLSLAWTQQCPSPLLSPSAAPDLSTQTLEEAMAGAFWSLVLDLCGPTLTLNHGEGGSAKDPKTMGPTAPDIFTSDLAEAALVLERGHFRPEPAGSSSLTRAIVG